MLTFQTTPFTLVIGILALMAVAVFCILSWRRSPHPRRTGILEAMRFLLALVVVLLLWKPEWRTVLTPDEKPRIAILWDDSKSMDTMDATLPPVLSNQPDAVSRAEWVKRALASPLWEPLASGGANDVRMMPFATPDADQAALSGTDLERPVSELLEKPANLRAVVVLSDGDANLGEPPVVAAQKLRIRGVPLFAIPVGSAVRLPDLDLRSVSAPAYGIVGENVQIPFTIRSSLDRQVRTVVRLRNEQGREVSKEITIPPRAEAYDSILWRLEAEGSTSLELSLPVVEGEWNKQNNSRKFTMAGKPEKIRVLVVESLPRWEYRFLRNALSRDPGVELSCLLFHPELGVGGGPDYVSSFPEKPEELARYDVIFLGDVGIGNNQLTKEQCAMIRGLVENQASGVIFMPGPQGNQFSLLNTELSDLVPVILDEGKKPGLSESVPAPLILTSEGRTSLLTMLGRNEEENPEIWRRLPGFYWHAPVVKAKAGTEVLATHGNRRGKFGPVPLLVTKPAGSGKVLFMGIDSAWRWRRGVEDLYHYRFWGQVARWMSYQRNMAAGQRIRLFFSPERPEPGSNVTLNANAFDANGAPLQDGTVSVDITAPDGRAQRLELRKNDSAWGAFSGRFRVDLPGQWKLRATISGAENQALETNLIAQGSEVEQVGQPARPEVLEEMARVSRGRVIQPGQLADIVSEIQALPAPKPLESRIPLWSHWIIVVALIIWSGLFWVGRKLNGVF